MSDAGVDVLQSLSLTVSLPLAPSVKTIAGQACSILCREYGSMQLDQRFLVRSLEGKADAMALLAQFHGVRHCEIKSQGYFFALP
jgi:hypothetical protein